MLGRLETDYYIETLEFQQNRCVTTVNLFFLGVRKFHSGSALSAKEYYSILGVDKSASTKDIKKVHNDLRSQ